MLSSMTLHAIKLTASVLWVVTAVVLAIGIGITTTGGLAMAVVGLVPPLALLFWWNEPSQTMSESIRQARR